MHGCTRTTHDLEQHSVRDSTALGAEELDRRSTPLTRPAMLVARYGARRIAIFRYGPVSVRVAAPLSRRECTSATIGRRQAIRRPRATDAHVTDAVLSQGACVRFGMPYECMWRPCPELQQLCEQTLLAQVCCLPHASNDDSHFPVLRCMWPAQIQTTQS